MIERKKTGVFLNKSIRKFISKQIINFKTTLVCIVLLDIIRTQTFAQSNYGCYRQRKRRKKRRGMKQNAQKPCAHMKSFLFTHSTLTETNSNLLTLHCYAISFSQFKGFFSFFFFLFCICQSIENRFGIVCAKRFYFPFSTYPISMFQLKNENYACQSEKGYDFCCVCFSTFVYFNRYLATSYMAFMHANKLQCKLDASVQANEYRK